jgi:flagellar basal-body rod modification protein FlgD
MAISPVNNNEQSLNDGAIRSNGSHAAGLKNEFLTLMVAQIQNQDPLNPLDGAEYVSQLAQFSTVEGIENMGKLQSNNNVLMNTMQVLQSAQLVGKEVSVPVERIQLEQAESLKGTLKLASSAEDVRVRAVGPDGKIAGEVALGPLSRGEFAFELPTLPAGNYTLQVAASRGGEVYTSIPNVQRVVEKVSVPPDGGDMRLQVSGVGSLSLFSVTDFLGAES